MLLTLLALLACDPKTDTPDDADTTDTTPTEADVDADSDTDTDTDTDTDSDTDTDADTDTDTDTDASPCNGVPVGLAPGECAPNFSLVDRDGVTHTLWDDYVGKVIILDFSGFT